MQQKWRAAAKTPIVRAMRLFLLFLVCVLLTGTALAADAIPAPSYFPVLPYDAPPDTAPQLVPVATNHPIDSAQPGIDRAIIVIHDESRDANAAMAGLLALAGTANATTMILAPQFMLPSDLARFANHLPEHGRLFATWDVSAWPWGGDSTQLQGRRSVSSFTIVDLLLMYLADRDRFPDLKVITIAGFGTGANFVQRYAAFGVAAAAVDKQNINLRYLVADASSFLYPTATRAPAGAKGLNHPDVTACPDYNAYPYGLDKLNGYTRRVGANEVKTNYVMHFVTYINAVAPDPLPDTSCAALAQGADSDARAVTYQAYLTSLYGDVATRTQIFARETQIKNDPVGLFGSSCGMAVLFGDGACVHAFGENR